MNKKNLKDYNRLLRAENEALKYILQEVEDSLSDGCRCGEIKLLQEENTELVKDINDLRADWAADHAAIINQHNADCSLSDMILQEFERDIEDLTRHRDRFHGTIKELKKEKYDMGVELEKLKKENSELGSKILDYKEDILNLQEQLGVQQ